MRSGICALGLAFCLFYTSSVFAEDEYIDCRIRYACDYFVNNQWETRPVVRAAMPCTIRHDDDGDGNCYINENDPLGRRFLDRCEFIGTYLIRTSSPGNPLCPYYKEQSGNMSYWWICSCKLSSDPYHDIYMMNW